MSINALAETKRQGKEVMIASGALAAGVLAVTTEFATIDSVQATIQSSTAPLTVTLTWSVSGNVVTVRGWKPTNASTTTLIATTGTETVNVLIVGRRR